MGKVIIVASGKGGTGKTTLTANLGAALSLRQKSVVVVDMDMGLRNLDVALGLESNIVYDVADIIENTCTLDDAIIKDSRFESLFFIPSPQTRDAASIAIENEEETWKKFWERLSDRFDFCLIDAPAGIEGGFKYALYGAHSAIIITLAETAALRDADRVISVLEDKGIEDIRLVINRIRPDMIEKGIMMNVDRCIDMLEIPILGIISDDIELISSTLKGELAVMNGKSKAGEAFKNIAGRILGENIPIMNLEDTDKKNLWERIKRLFGKRKE